jgi:predicted ATPase
VWDGQADRIRFQVKASPPEAGRDPARNSLTYELRLARIPMSSSYRVEYELLANYCRVEAREMMDPFKLIQRHALSAKVFDHDEKSLVPPEEDLSEEETLLSLAGGPFTSNRLIRAYQKQLEGWCVYHDLHVNREAPIRQPAVTKLEKRVQPDGQNLISVLHTLYTGDRDFKREINLAMRTAFGDDFDELVFPPAADQRIQLRIRWKSLKREQSAAEISDGTLRFLFLLTVLASPEAAPVIAIDEPETGLHPSMFPIVAEYAVEASEKSQVILTTHSPQILDAFKEIFPKTTVMMWQNGQTELKVLEGDRLTKWLEAYSLGNLFKSGELEALA